VPKAKVQMVLRGVLVAVLRERAKLKFSEKYNTKQVVHFYEPQTLNALYPLPYITINTAPDTTLPS